MCWILPLMELNESIDEVKAIVGAVGGKDEPGLAAVHWTAYEARFFFRSNLYGFGRFDEIILD